MFHRYTFNVNQHLSSTASPPISPLHLSSTASPQSAVDPYKFDVDPRWLCGPRLATDLVCAVSDVQAIQKVYNSMPVSVF